MIASLGSRYYAASSVVVMPSGVGADRPAARHVRRLNGVLLANTAPFFLFADLLHCGGIAPEAAVSRSEVSLVAHVASSHPVHSLDETFLIASRAGVECLDACGADWYVHSPGSTRGPAVRGGAASVLFPLHEGCIDTTQSAACGNAINQ